MDARWDYMDLIQIENGNHFLQLMFYILIFILCFRCNTINQVKQYAKIAHNIQYAVDETKIFQLTGCLAKCDKYYYSAQARSELKPFYNTAPDAPSFYISFLIPNGQNEVKEQVEMKVNLLFCLDID